MSLLPLNETALERDMDEAFGARMEGLPVPVDSLWSPDFCPETLLSWLAWGIGIEEWNSKWSVDEKRGVIRNAPEVFRRTGTRGALERALRPFGYKVDIVEWWERRPNGMPGTFDLELRLPSGQTPSEARYAEVKRIAKRAGNIRSHIANIVLKPADETSIPVLSAAITSGITTTLYPLGRIGLGDELGRVA